MRKQNMKRVFVVAAAVYVLGTITMAAARKVVYTDGKGSHLDGFTCDRSGEAGTKLGYTINIPETFSDGYRSDMGMPIHRDAMDQGGNIIKSAKGFSLNYKKDENPDVLITAQGISLYDEEGQPDQTSNHNGITLNYTRDQYRLVPPGYQIPDEEKAKEATEELYISYGSNKVQDKVAQSMLWKDGEKVYTITAMDNPMTTRDMAQTIGGLIGNKQ